MKQRSIYVTEFDLKRLKDLLDAETAFGTRNRPDLIGLQNELARAHVVSPKAVPSDVITMNSRVTLVDLGTNEEITYELVFPADADAEPGSHLRVRANRHGDAGLPRRRHVRVARAGWTTQAQGEGSALSTRSLGRLSPIAPRHHTPQRLRASSIGTVSPCIQA